MHSIIYIYIYIYTIHIIAFHIRYEPRLGDVEGEDEAPTLGDKV